MITKVRLRYFKRFEEQVFDLTDHIVLAGPNNSGKTTLLQGIVAWNLALQKWKAERGGAGPAHRSGVPVTRKDFTAIPVSEMNLLWTDRSTALRKADAPEGKPGFPRTLEITVEATQGGVPWELTMEFRYQSTEQVYVKPAEKHADALPKAAEEFSVVHVPPFSGIGTEETRFDRPYQDLLIGQGKAGDILRNLLLEVRQSSDKEAWKGLCGVVEEVFGYALQPPEYGGKPFIVCEYVPGPRRRGERRAGGSRLDIASAGSGFHQVLLLLGFFFARPSSVLLLDEPDAHLHVILQKQVYDLLRRMARRRDCQLIVATHSEVMIDGTSPGAILSFYNQPHRLVDDTERDQIREALKRLTAMDILLAEDSPGILYVEGETDFDLLGAWARVLGHPLKDWFAERPFWHSNQGRNPREARAHFFSLRAVKPGLKGILLLDGDNRKLPDHEIAAEGLAIRRWRRYEAESYLVHPGAMLRFVQSHAIPLFCQKAEALLKGKLPPDLWANPMGEDDYLTASPASKSVLPPFFAAADVAITKNEYHLVAEQMKPEEIHPDVKQMLDAIAQALGVAGGGP
jgi:predicted ATPase